MLIDTISVREFVDCIFDNFPNLAFYTMETLLEDDGLQWRDAALVDDIQFVHALEIETILRLCHAPADFLMVITQGEARYALILAMLSHQDKIEAYFSPAS